MTARRPIRQRDLTRALKGAAAAGVTVSRIEIDKDGRIIMLTGKPGEPSGEQDLERWLEKNATAS